MSSGPKVLFYVQHLLGIGHVYCATRVARALSVAGARVHLVWGGTQVPSFRYDGFDVTFLDPVKTESETFSALVHPDGRSVSDAEKHARQDQLLALFAATEPDIVMTEAFPFGRRQMRFELVPLMQAARAAAWQPLNVASIRDIMQEGRADKRVNESLDAFRNWYDLLLVHGDPALIRIEDSLQGAETIRDAVRYTGLVTPDPVDLSVPPSIHADVVVSAGGGAVGHALTSAAIDAHRHCRSMPGNWLIIVGPERAEAEYADLATRAGESVRIVRHVPDMARVLAAARVSVSRAGYNTVGDLLRARCRCVLVPFEGGRETEQLRRAQMFAEHGLAIQLHDRDLSAERIGKAVDSALALPVLDAGFDLDGARRSAEILLAEHDRRASRIASAN